MTLEKLLEEAFLVKPDEAVSHVVYEMGKRGVYEAFVFDRELKGIVTLDDIVRRSVSEPHKVKVSYFMRPANPFSVDADIEDVVNYVLVNEYRSVPFEKDGKIYALNKAKLLGFVKEEVFEGKTAEDVMQFPYCVSEDDTLSTVISVMKDTGLNRIPVLDKNGRFAGFVDSMSLSKILIDKHRAKRGERGGEKIKTSDVHVKTFVRNDALRVRPETPLGSVVKNIEKSGLQVVVVENEGKFLGMLTMKDIFKLIGKSLETVYIRITGLGEEDDFIKVKVNEMVENTVRKIVKFLKVNYVTIHVEIHKKEGRRRKYSVQGRFVTDKGNFYASDYEWEPTKAMKLFLEKIEREIDRRVGKERDAKIFSSR